MTLGHLLLATGMTLYVLIAMRYEERDLLQRFGGSYTRWRSESVARKRRARACMAEEHAS